MKLKRTLMAAAFCGIVFTFCGCCSTRPNRHKRGEAENHERGLPVSEGCRSVATSPRSREISRGFARSGRSISSRGSSTSRPAPEKERLPPARRQRKDRTLRHEGGRMDPALRHTGPTTIGRRRRPRCSTPIPRSRRCTAQTTTIRRCSISRMLRRRSTPSHTSRW